MRSADTKNRPLAARLRFAWHGVRLAWQRERSVRTQVRIAFFLFVVLAVLRPAPLWWGLAVLAVVVVLSAELVNSALEALIDHLHPDIDPGIRRVKDIAAGAVLVAAAGAVLIGVLLLVSVM